MYAKASWRNYNVIEKTSRLAGRSTEFTEKPASRQPPIAVNGLLGNLEFMSRFFHTQTTKKTQLDHLGFSWILQCKFLKGFVERDLFRILDRYRESRVKRNSQRFSSALGSHSASSRFHQYTSHNSRRKRKEVDTVTPLNASYVH